MWGRLITCEEQCALQDPEDSVSTGSWTYYPRQANYGTAIILSMSDLNNRMLDGNEVKKSFWAWKKSREMKGKKAFTLN